jgi:hypothetical protein
MSTHISKSFISVNDIKFDLLKVAEIYDGLLQDGLGYLASDMFSKYLDDLKNDNQIYSYEITDVVLKEQSYTYDINVQITQDRTPKKLKIHVGLYKSAWPSLYSKMKYTGSGYVPAQ